LNDDSQKIALFHIFSKFKQLKPELYYTASSQRFPGVGSNAFTYEYRYNLILKSHFVISLIELIERAHAFFILVIFRGPTSPPLPPLSQNIDYFSLLVFLSVWLVQASQATFQERVG
jgi:hypothetical protein